MVRIRTTTTTTTNKLNTKQQHPTNKTKQNKQPNNNNNNNNKQTNKLNTQQQQHPTNKTNQNKQPNNNNNNNHTLTHLLIESTLSLSLSQMFTAEIIVPANVEAIGPSNYCVKQQAHDTLTNKHKRTHAKRTSPLNRNAHKNLYIHSSTHKHTNT